MNRLTLYLGSHEEKPLKTEENCSFVYKKLESMEKRGYNRHATWIIP